MSNAQALLEEATLPELMWLMEGICHCTPACRQCRIESGHKHANDWACWREKRRWLDSEAEGRG